ncbi:MAG: hydrogenase maturation protease [Candidatus Hydrogenedentes bacterium]|nr:hydrogenase maturation protease [Candidatus Hydrogenedentota bacterium]
MNETSESPSVLVIGVGNRFRGDDAAGPCVADSVRARARHGVRVVEHSGEGASLMDLWDGAGCVFLIDAADSGGAPGFIYEFDAHEHVVPAEFLMYSTHAFGVAEAIELSRAFDRLPPRLYVYAIEGKDFGAGRALSAEVADAVDSVVATVLERIEQRDQAPCTSSPL